MQPAKSSLWLDGVADDTSLIHRTHRLGGPGNVGFISDDGSTSFRRKAKCTTRKPSKPSEDGRSDYATLAPNAHLAPGESTTITFVLAWYFPVRENYWHDDDEKMKGKLLTNYYGTRFKSAWDVSAVTRPAGCPNWKAKRARSPDTFFSSTLPP